MKEERIRQLKNGISRPGPIVYWMSRDQRAEDNWALTFAQKLALEQSEPLRGRIEIYLEYLSFEPH